MTDILEIRADVRFDHECESFLRVDALCFRNEIRPGLIPISENAQIPTDILVNQNGTFVLEEALGMRTFALLFNTEMEHALRQRAVHDRREQIGNAKKNNVVFDVERASWTDRKTALGDVDFFQGAGPIRAVLQGLRQASKIILKIENVVLVSERVWDEVILLVIMNIVRGDLENCRITQFFIQVPLHSSQRACERRARSFRPFGDLNFLRRPRVEGIH